MNDLGRETNAGLAREVRELRRECGRIRGEVLNLRIVAATALLLLFLMPPGFGRMAWILAGAVGYGAIWLAVLLARRRRPADEEPERAGGAARRA